MTSPHVPLSAVAVAYLSRLTESPTDPTALDALRGALLFGLRCARAHSEDLASVREHQSAP
jgi:hypothetical protein